MNRKILEKLKREKQRQEEFKRRFAELEHNKYLHRKKILESAKNVMVRDFLYYGGND